MTIYINTWLAKKLFMDDLSQLDLYCVIMLFIYIQIRILDFLCSDCNGAWEVPTATIYALIYWILMTSIFSYLILTWATKFVAPSISLAYSATQPLTAAVLSEIIIASNAIDQCSKKNNYEK